MNTIEAKSETRRGKGRPREFERQTALKKALEVFWESGFEPASVSRLCQAMGINPPSLYATFGNKKRLFLEALRFYEDTYWREPTKQLESDPDIRSALAAYFDKAAEIILAPDNPCGCMLVTAAVNIADSEKEIIDCVREMRDATRKMFVERLRRAIRDGQIPADEDIQTLAATFNSLLEGMSLQARAGLSQSELKAVASRAVRILPAIASRESS